MPHASPPPHHPPRYHMSDCISTATNNHVYWKQAIEVGAGLIICSCQEDSAETQPLYYHYNNQGGFLPRCFLISVDFLSHVEKNLRFVFFLTKKKNLSTWCHGLVRQPNVTAWFDVPLGWKCCTRFCCWGGKRDMRVNVTFISLNITLHRVQFCHGVKEEMF